MSVSAVRFQATRVTIEERLSEREQSDPVRRLSTGPFKRYRYGDCRELKIDCEMSLSIDSRGLNAANDRFPHSISQLAEVAEASAGSVSLSLLSSTLGWGSKKRL
ncbi:hypothetical protein BY996DRAFT_6419617 [Phakopsora pachyrhizi]|nr:hypothetical protein BY996DRAFT_6419617 [Phakopsora pachyrhizi]